MIEDKDRGVVRKLAALLVFAAAVAAVIVFRSRISADFWPLDSSRVGPNLVASIVQWAVIFIAAVLLYPPWRRRLHRLIDAKLKPLHEHAKRQEQHNEWAAKAIASMHLKVTGEHVDRHPHFKSVGPPAPTPIRRRTAARKVPKSKT
jgi:hypothetical protein